MIAQLIIGPADEEMKTDQAIQTFLEEAGFQVNLLEVDKAVQLHQREMLVKRLSDQAVLTVANSGIRWNNVARLVSPELLPNSIVITSEPGMHSSLELKPVIILAREADLADRLFQAIKSLGDGMLHLPDRSGAYEETSYGLRLRERGGDAPIDIWQRFSTFLYPGYRFSTRVRPDGSTTQFIITKIMDGMVVLKVEGSEQIIAVTKEDLGEHYEAWSKAKRGEAVKGILINDYVMGILDWMDDAHLLA
jgi:hypothetical protein